MIKWYEDPVYILMCEKSEEIQGLWTKKEPVIVHSQPYLKEYLLHIWLPTQVQLQIISGLSWKDFDMECLKYEANTKEQAGIQVAMFELRQKKWNGEDWVLK